MKNLRIFALWLVVTLSPAKASDFASTVMEATFKFFHPDSTSTCLLVRREADSGLYLVTCAHTLEKTKGDTATLVLRRLQEDGSYKRHDHKIPIRQGDRELWTRHEKQDVAVLRLREELPVKVAGLSESCLLDQEHFAASGVHLCGTLFMLTYPERFEANGAGFPVARQGIFSSPPSLPAASHPTFLGDFTTFAGDSGAPVFIPGENGSPRIVGIMIGQHHHNVTTKSIFEESKIKLSLGMGIILHAEYVRETLTAAAGKEK